MIPVIEAKTNSSLEFVNLVSRLYYKNGNHLDMAHKKMKYFLYFVRSKYGIHAEKFKEDQIRRLAEKSKVALGEIEAIFHQYYLIEDRFKQNIEANRLVDLYDAFLGREEELTRFGSGDVHPNADGYAVIADTILEALSTGGA